ncbi:MAG: HD domain-containing phosphohydrolase [Eubacteriales bacterium]
MKEKIKFYIVIILFIVNFYIFLTQENTPLDRFTYNIEWTQKEKDYINNNRSIKVELLNEFTPVYYKDGDMEKGMHKYIFANFRQNITGIELSKEKKSDTIRIGSRYLFDKDQYMISKPFYHKKMNLYVADANINDIYSLIESKEHITIGIIEGNKEEILRNYNITKKVDFKIYSDESEIVKELKENKIDAIITGYDLELLSFNWDEIKRIPLNSLSADFVFAINKESPKELLSIINRWIDELKNDNNAIEIMHNEELKYYRDNIKFSEQEKEWLKENPVIDYGAHKDYEPYHIANNNQGSGISSKVIKDISKIINVDFQMINKNTWDDTYKACENGEVTFLPFIGNNHKRKGVLFTNSVYTTDLVIISHSEDSYMNRIHDLENKNIVILKDYIQVDEFYNNTSNVTIEEKDSLKDVLSTLTQKKADYSLVDLLVLNNYIKKDKINYKVTGRLRDELNYYFAVNKDHKPLVSIFNKIIPFIDIDTYYYEYGVVNDKQYHYKYIYIILICFILAIFIITLYGQKFNYQIKTIKKSKQDLIKLNTKYETIIYQMIGMFESVSFISQDAIQFHTKRLIYYAEIIARELQLDDFFIQSILQFIPIHDIGNIAISSSILNKPGEFSPEEYDKVKSHVIAGYELVRRLELGKVAENIVLFHHERWDGKGYPKQLKGEQIPIEARILNLVDTYDILRIKRPYKQAYTHKQAVEIIVEEKGKQFDPKLVEMFVQNNLLFDIYYELGQEMRLKIQKLEE